MNELAISTEGLKKHYRGTEAVRGLDLRVRKGSVYGFLGRNGAGKTTTIKMLLGLLRPTSGSASVLGMDPTRQDYEIKRRVGYVAENQKMYGWMTVEEICGFCASLYTTWNDSLCEKLISRLELPKGQKLRALSRGMQAKVALVLALAHEPELLILDDPTSGLDAVVRREFVESVVALIHEEGRTVFFSSHMIDEVERVADWVGILHQGKLMTAVTKDEIKNAYRRVRLIYPGKAPTDLKIEGTVTMTASVHEVMAIVRGFGPEEEKKLRASGAKTVEVLELSLEDIFVALVGSRRSGNESSVS